MGRRRKEDSLDFDVPPSTPGMSGVEQPTAEDPLIEALKDPKAVLAQSLGIDPSRIDDMMEWQKNAQVFTAAQEIKRRAQEFRSELEAEQIQKRAALSAKQRTQALVEQILGKNPDLPRWKVFLQADPDSRFKPEQLDLEIPANTEAEAIIWYQRFCGIRSTDHFIRAMRKEKYNSIRAARDAKRDMEEEFEQDDITAFQEGHYEE